MKKINNVLATLILIFVFVIPASLVNAAGKTHYGPLSAGPQDPAGSVGAENNIVWSGWNNYPNTDIFYRIQVMDEKNINSEMIAIEVMNNYKRDVSFSMALNDDGLQSSYKPVYKLRKKKSTILNYPKPKDSKQLWAFIKSVELE